MENLKRKERRISDRKALNGLLPGRLQTERGVDLDCRPVDVSPHGLGVIIDQELRTGTSVRLVLRGRTIALEIAWVQRDFAKEELFRYGLTTTDQSVNLENIFLEAGCLR